MFDFSDWTYQRCTGAVNYLVCAGPGQLGAVIINKRVVGATIRLTDGLKDEATGSGQGIIAEITEGTAVDAPTFILYGCEFSRGLNVNFSSSTVEVTVIYKREKPESS